MLTDIEQLKNDFLIYLNFLVFAPQEDLFEKIKPLEITKLRKIEFQSHSDGKLSIIRKSEKTPITLTLTKKELGIYGLNNEEFKRSIEAIKNNGKDREKLLFQAVEEAINLNNKKLCEIYIPSAILTYTKLFEKNADFKEKDSSHDSLLLNCLDAISPKKPNSNQLVYNLITFIRAYQYRDLNFNDFLKTIPPYQDDGTCEYIFNTIKTIQLTPFKETYINLIQSIEELDKLQVKDKSAINNLIIKLKDTTTVCFRDLTQAAFYTKQEKYIREKEVTKKLRNDCIELIKDYRDEHVDEFKKQLGSFQKILQIIVNNILTLFLSDSKKMTFFFNKEENYNKKTSEVTSQLDQLANLNFFSRAF